MPTRDLKTLRELNGRVLGNVHDCEDLLARSKRVLGKTNQDNERR